MPAPGDAGIFELPAQLRGAVQLAPVLAFEEIEMELAVIVGHRGLLGVTHACDGGSQPQNPVMFAEKGREGVFAQHYGDVDGRKPEIAAEAVEYASYA